MEKPSGEAHAALRWGVNGDLGIDELEEAIRTQLGGEAYDVSVGYAVREDGVTLRSVVYEEARPDVLWDFEMRDVVCLEHRFTRAVYDQLNQMPHAPITLTIECFPVEESWSCVIRTCDLWVKSRDCEWLEDDLLFANTLARRLLTLDEDGHRECESVHVLWFDGTLSASAYDWRGNCAEELKNAHLLPVRMGREAGEGTNAD